MSKLGNALGVITALVVGVVAAPRQAHALPVLGGQIFANGGTVTVEILPKSASFTDHLFLDPPPGAGPASPIATNNDVGSIFNLGSFAAGTELVFGITADDTDFGGGPGPTFFEYRMGPASRNPDGVIHATVNFLDASTADVAFEDKNVATPGYDNDLNDTIFRFVGVAPENPIPEPASMVLFGLGALGAGLLRGRKRSV